MDESSAAETAAVSEIALLSENTEDDGGSDDVDGTALVYVPPKSQLEKELDGLRGKTGTGGVVSAICIDRATAKSHIIPRVESGIAGDLTLKGSEIRGFHGAQNIP